jgi:hypothetical protein
MTVDNLFIIHDKVKVISTLEYRTAARACFLKSINNKSTTELLKK